MFTVESSKKMICMTVIRYDKVHDGVRDLGQNEIICLVFPIIHSYEINLFSASTVFKVALPSRWFMRKLKAWYDFLF